MREALLVTDALMGLRLNPAAPLPSAPAHPCTAVNQQPHRLWHQIQWQSKVLLGRGIKCSPLGCREEAVGLLCHCGVEGAGIWAQGSPWGAWIPTCVYTSGMLIQS